MIAAMSRAMAGAIRGPSSRCSSTRVCQPRGAGGFIRKRTLKRSAVDRTPPRHSNPLPRAKPNSKPAKSAIPSKMSPARAAASFAVTVRSVLRWSHIVQCLVAARSPPCSCRTPSAYTSPMPISAPGIPSSAVTRWVALRPGIWPPWMMSRRETGCSTSYRSHERRVLTRATPRASP